MAPTRPIITSPAENKNLAIRVTPGIPFKRDAISEISGPSMSASPYGITIRWAFRASTLSWNSRSKPLVTPSTTTSDATPSTTPIVETVVNTEKVRSRNATTATSAPISTAMTAVVSAPRDRPCAAAKAAKPRATSSRPATIAARAPGVRRPRCR